MKEILTVVSKHKIAIIADEIYADIVFSGRKYTAFAALLDSFMVPVISVGGISKKFMVPGWRLGWILIHDTENLLVNVRQALNSLSQIINGPNTVIQAALPKILHETPESYHQENIKKLESNADLACNILKRIPGLCPITPDGAMYVMVGIDFSKFKDLKDDVNFSEKLMEEESVLCLPGQVPLD